MSNLKTIFSTRLKQAFKDSKDWNQSKAATYFKVSRNTINSWAAGTNFPGYDTIDELAKILSVTPQWLMGANDPTANKQAAIAEIKALMEPDDKELESFIELRNINPHQFEMLLAVADKTIEDFKTNEEEKVKKA